MGRQGKTGKGPPATRNGVASCPKREARRPPPTPRHPVSRRHPFPRARGPSRSSRCHLGCRSAGPEPRPQDKKGPPGGRARGACPRYPAGARYLPSPRDRAARGRTASQGRVPQGTGGRAGAAQAPPGEGGWGRRQRPNPARCPRTGPRSLHGPRRGPERRDSTEVPHQPLVGGDRTTGAPARHQGVRGGKAPRPTGEARTLPERRPLGGRREYDAGYASLRGRTGDATCTPPSAPPRTEGPSKNIESRMPSCG